MIIDDIAFRALLNKGEVIRYVGHIHPFTIYPQLFKVLLVGLAMPIAGYLLFPPFYAIWIGWALVGLMLFGYRVTQWYLDAWVVTNYAVIDQDWNSFFDKSTTRIEFGNIEGMTNEVKGFWGTILRYGNIQIEHMSGEPVMLSNVATPRKLEKHIVKHQQEFMERRNFEDHSKLQDLLTGLLRSTHKKG